MRSAELVGVAQTIACCGEIVGIGHRCEIAQRRVRPSLVVIIDSVDTIAAPTSSDYRRASRFRQVPLRQRDTLQRYRRKLVESQTAERNRS
jgi:hypothetical protein